MPNLKLEFKFKFKYTFVKSEVRVNAEMCTRWEMDIWIWIWIQVTSSTLLVIWFVLFIYRYVYICSSCFVRHLLVLFLSFHECWHIHYACITPGKTPTIPGSIFSAVTIFNILLSSTEVLNIRVYNRSMTTFCFSFAQLNLFDESQS